MDIREDDLAGPEITRLLTAHMDFMVRHTPPGSIYALDPEALRVPEITFWTAWEDGTLLGCGALRELAPDHGEIKSMHAAEQVRGRGVGREVLGFIITEAENRDYRRLSLETGNQDGFKPARQLYERFGFVECGPFGDYDFDPNSVYMTRKLGD